MHWFFLLILLCLIFLATYDPRSGTLSDFFAPQTSVEDGQSSREAQGYRDTDERD